MATLLNQHEVQFCIRLLKHTITPQGLKIPAVSYQSFCHEHCNSHNMIQVLEIRVGTVKVSTLACLTQATLIKYAFPDVWLQSIIQTDILQRFILIHPVCYNLVRQNKK